MIGILALGTANAAVLLGAVAIVRRVGSGRRSLDLALVLLVRLGLISVAILAAGLTGCLTPAGLGFGGVVALVLLVASGAHRGLARPTFPTGTVGVTVWLVVGLIALKLLAQVWFFAPHLVDTLSYHLPKVAEWIRAGSFGREMGADPLATLPAGFELVETWWVVFLRHDVLIEMAGLEFLALAAAATAALARGLGLSIRAAAVAAVGVALTPGLALQAVQAMNDGPVAALVLVTAALASAGAPLALLGFAAGLGVGTKATFAFALPGLMLLRLRPADATRPVWRTAGVSAAALLAMGVALGGFWYARNVVWFGNPIQPVSVEGYEDAKGRRVNVKPDPARLVRSTAEFVGTRLADDRGPYGGLLREMAGWGAIPVALGIPAFLLALSRRGGYRRLAGALAISAAGVLLFAETDRWFGRFLLFFPAVPILAAAAWYESSRLVRTLAAAGAALQLAGTLVPAELTPEDVRALARPGWRARTFAAEPVDLSGVAVAGTWAEDRGDSYLAYGPGFSRRVVPLRPSSLAGLPAAIAGSRADAFLLEPSTEPGKAAIASLVSSGRLVPIGGSWYRSPR